MLRVSFSPAPECVVADCWNRAFPTPPCHQGTVIIIIIVLYLNKLLGGERVFWKAIYTTLKYFGLAGWLQKYDVLKSNIWHWDRNSYAGVEHVFTLQKLHLFQKIRKISGSSRRDLKLGSVKTRFKAFWDDFCENLHAALVSQVVEKVNFSTQYEIYWIFRLSHEAYVWNIIK